LGEVVGQRGWVLLGPVQRAFQPPSEPDAVIVGGAEGGCGQQAAGDYAMDDQRHVHLLQPRYVAGRYVKQTVCGCDRYACGGEALPPMTFFVRAAARAVLAEPVSLTVTLDENADFESESGACPPMP
jgi:hypothetical protein